MKTPRLRFRNSAEGGFSMVELLMTAFILAVGILGLSLLQVMALQTSRGGRSLTTAVQVADRAMDQVELEGRLTWMNLTDSQYTAPVAIGTLQFIGKGPVVQTFTIKGETPDPLSLDPTDSTPYYTVTTTQGAQVGASTIGQMHDYSVLVEFYNAADATHTAVKRTVTLSRRILHG